MLIFWKEKLVLLATPKTGSTALEQSLSGFADIAFRNPPRLKHITARNFRKNYAKLFLPSDARGFELVALMREPLSWLGSWYRYRSRDALLGHPNSTREISFEKFVKDYMSPSRPAYSDIGSQHKFLTGQSGQTLVDHIFDYARMDQAAAFLENRLCLNLALPELNISPKSDLILPAEIENEYRKTYAADFSLYSEVRTAAVGRDT